MIGDGDCGEIGGMKTGSGKPKYSEKTCPSATFSTTNPKWPDPVLNPGRRGGKPATNRLNYGAASYKEVSWGTGFFPSDNFPIIVTL
jgi:hypothetical protein